MDSGVDSGADSAWNFEISVWDESCLKELTSKTNENPTSSSKTTKKTHDSMFSFVANLPVDFLKASTTSTTSDGSGMSGWNDVTNSKTLFIDPNDMDLLVDDFIDSEDEVGIRIRKRLFCHLNPGLLAVAAA